MEDEDEGRKDHGRSLKRRCHCQSRPRMWPRRGSFSQIIKIKSWCYFLNLVILRKMIRMGRDQFIPAILSLSSSSARVTEH